MPEDATAMPQGAVLSALFDASADGFIGIGPDGRVTYANDEARRLLGNQTAAEGALAAELEPRAVADLAAACRDGACGIAPELIDVGERELAIRTWSAPDGSIALALHDDSQLVGRRERIEAVLNATTDGLIVLSPRDVVTYLNPAIVEILDLDRDAVVGREVSVDELLGIEPIDQPDRVPCWEMMSCELPDCPAYGADDIRCWLIEGTMCCSTEPQHFAAKRERCSHCEVWERDSEAFDALSGDGFEEIELRRPEVTKVVKVRVTPVVGERGEYMGRVVVVRDITHEHEIAQMKNEFVSTVSHELRTPMTSIKGYVDLILDGDAGEINEVQREFLGIVKENSDRLVALINDMLDISRIESGRIHLKVEPLCIDDSIDDAVDTFRGLLTQTGREVTIDAPPDLEPVAADRDRIGQVLVNFISNALKYSPDGGPVRVAAHQDDGMVTVEVTDQGLGISREDQKLLFTKFYRVDSAITREIGGTGLGLSICKSIVELLGGRIGVKSAPGEGSTFWFSLPVASTDLIRTPRAQAPEGARGTVMVVDRDPGVASLIETYLVKQGYDVVKAHTADEALATAARVHPDAITLDVILDEGDGFELLQRFKEREETARIPVVVLSIVCDEGRSCRFGAANYLEKPIDQARLLDIVGNLVGSTTSPLALVVDDDRSAVEMVSEMLRRRGFATAAAYDGFEALAAVAERPPDVMLLDLRMPKLDGYEVIKRMKEHEAWASVPIVVMTAHRIDSEHTDLLELTAGQIAKPMSPEDIAAQIDELMTPRLSAGGI